MIKKLSNFNEIQEIEPIQKGTGAQKIYYELRRDILCLDLKPGKLLDEATLSKQFGMSRSPVREALIRLSMEGLVVTLPNKSTLVSHLNIEEYPNYLDALDLIQRVTARLAARLRTKSHLIEIKKTQQDFLAALNNGSVIDMIDKNRNFHMAISSAANNSYFDFLHARLMDDGRRMLHLYFRSFGSEVPQTLSLDHDRMIDAIEKQNEDDAETYAHEHVNEVGKRFLKYLNSRQTDKFVIKDLT